jgi:type III restriction enzyme
MKIVLKDFQEIALDALQRHVRWAQQEATDTLQAVLLSAPTGAGKTLVITALMERIVEGDETRPGNPDAIFLWVTDAPELNEQTRRKIVTTSSTFLTADLITLDSAFDAPRLSAGKVYFLNIQKLGRDRQMVTKGENRQFTIWETISQTAKASATNLYLVLDEAHKGMLESTRDRSQAASIVQKFLKGSPGEIPPIPLVIGISATPERFSNLVQGSRTVRQESVLAEDVRESGLLKERLQLFHPKQTKATDWSLLRAAAEKWQTYRREWEQYCDEQGVVDVVRPLLVVQVEDSVGKNESKTDLAEALREIEAVTGPLADEAIAHSFQEGHEVLIGDRHLRRIAPADIQDDPDLQVVFFKVALNTGWDCPRAEVMMSFRRAVDHTLIAQLVGRMVRTPLARKVESNEALNSVSLYLPYYDEKGLKKVVDRLTKPDPEDQMAVDVVEGDEIIELGRAAETGELFERMTKLPSYQVARRTKLPNTKRLMRLARALAYDKLDESALTIAMELAVDHLLAELERVQGSKEFEAALGRSEQVQLRAVTLLYLVADSATGSDTSVKMVANNVNDLFETCGRQLGDGLHLAYARARVDADGGRPLSNVKQELFALLQSSGVLAALQNICGDKVEKWLSQHAEAIRELPESRRDVYNQVRRTATKPEPTTMNPPQKTQWRTAEDRWKRHVYADEAGEFPMTFGSSWERKTLEGELTPEDSTVVGWLRNPDRKSWALCVPYEMDGTIRPMYPDFLVFRRETQGLVVDILDPHNPGLPDAWTKAKGLALYAGQHGDHYGRIEIIIEDGHELRRLDLNREATRAKVLKVNSNEYLRQLFE